MIDLLVKSPAFQQAELRSEGLRVGAQLGVLVCLTALVVVRGAAIAGEGSRGELWPFILLLLIAICYEAAWLFGIRRWLRVGRSISTAAWRWSVAVECALPTIVIFLQIHTKFVGPARALMSPVVLTYFLFIVLSTLHLDTALSRLAGACSAAGYTAAAAYVYLRFPQTAAGEEGLVYTMWLSYAAILLLGGIAAGSVADQIRKHLVVALSDVESRARIARIEHELDIARSVQRGLLPRTPPIAGDFDIAGWNQSANETGGDYFDWQELEDGRVMVTVADVTGHGIGPALCMAACRAYARATFASQPELRRALGSLNRLLYDDFPSEKFVTLAAGLLDPGEGTLDLISAGQGPLLFFLSSESRFRSYDAQGPPLGLLPDSTYRGPERLRFAPGDILALITDGMIESVNAHGQQFGQKRLKEVIRVNHNRPAAMIVSELHDALRKFSGPTPQHDDLTVLVVKRT
jgi:hypothetical protein